MVKVLMQVNVKMGGQLWYIPREPGYPALTMVAGMDVYHDTKHRGRSVLAFVASLTPNFTSYYSQVAY